MKKKKKKKKVVLLLTSKAESFDYYKLALQWTPGFCHGKKKCRVPISQFMVYGLYPQLQEWTKHGTVSDMTPVEYLKQVMAAFRAIDSPLDSLRVSGIVPTNKRTYTATAIKSAV
ncbi:hypothetical protein LINPERPRIM_LOCUS32956 [Linum perenne]